MKEDIFSPITVNGYFSWLEKNISSDTALYRAAHQYLEEFRKEDEKRKAQEGQMPFLSIITRTQGKRPDMLNDVLLSLTGQSNTDFELLIMGHNLSDEQHETVSGLISEQPEWLREKTRLIPVTGGSRATPLNAGFEEARGKYITVLDDDDLVFDHWVETFYELSKKADGKILHAYSIIQDWETVGGDFPNSPCAVGHPETYYCCDFDLINQLTVNRCPFCALAFPAFAFRELGMRFDETLTTTEDWDFLMRTAFVTGVEDSSEITFLYRNWLNSENSSSLHQKDEWERNYKYVVARFSKTPFIVPVGGLQRLYDSIINVGDNTDASAETPAVVNDVTELFYDVTELFYDDGVGFVQQHKWKRLPSNDKDFAYLYTSEQNVYSNIKGIRFDPQHNGMLLVEGLIIRIIDTDGQISDFFTKDIVSNGHIIGTEQIAFLKSDPQISLMFDKPKDVKEVYIGCELKEIDSDAELDAVIACCHIEGRKGKKSIFYRALRKGYRLFKRILGKK